jgi:GH18 family chitinase
VVSPQLRSKFVASAIRLLEDHGLDGLDVDYEYPSNEAQAHGYVELLRELRFGLDEHARKKGANYRFLLTVSVCPWHSAVIPRLTYCSRSPRLVDLITIRSCSYARWMKS